MAPLKRTENDLIQQAAEILLHNLKRGLTIAQLSGKVLLSEKKLKAGFKNVFNMGVYAFLRKKRLEHASTLLLDGASVKEAGSQVGYRNKSAFTKAFKQEYGEAPAEWYKKQTA